MDIGSMAAALASMKTATDIATALMGFKTDAAVQGKAAELTRALLQVQQQLLGAQLEQMSLIKRIELLEAELKNAKKQDELADRYMRHQFETGYVAYKLRPDYQGEQPVLYFCSNCLEKEDSLITLHGKDKVLSCPSCNTSIRATPAPPRKVIRNRSSYF